MPNPRVRQDIIRQQGAGFFDKVANVFTNSQSNDSEKYYKLYKDWYVTAIAVHRSPVQSAVQKLLKVISFGKFDVKNTNYDELYHLFIVFQ